jgi:hypothetical protein
MQKKKPAPTWRADRVRRADAGGTLWNAVHVSSGHEYWGVPSYDAEAIGRRVQALNEARAPLGRAKPVNLVRTIEDIFNLYDGQEVNGETHARIVEILTNAGYVVREPLDELEPMGCNTREENVAEMMADEERAKAKADCEYDYEHLEAAACMWEHVLHRLRRVKPGDKNPWDEYRNAYGMAALREAVIRHAPTLETEYQAAVANGFNEPFDWEYVPKYMEQYVTRILT